MLKIIIYNIYRLLFTDTENVSKTKRSLI